MSTISFREEVLFSDALALSATERASFLNAACEGDVALRERLNALLAAHENSRLELPVVDRRPVTYGAEEKAGDRIGRYKLLEKIGEGGCGTVYLAEQQEPVRRQVALKVIKLGMDTHDVIGRFEAERQALALMNHPNIARVFDAGATDTGRPYFVMELVTGTRITVYCDEHSLSTAARLKLFAQVCQAIQHAHQKGIIHRDIKPSNILVTEHDGVAVPKVIDFGIAKATHGRLTDRTVLTAIAQFIGTPVYMSPEQAELKGVDIDTRSDIYSLGVLLYELIAGRPPFDPQTLLSAGLDEIRRHIREVEPPSPSTRLSTLSAADRATIAQDRGTDAVKLSLLLRGDLDWIVMRCLEKDRARRYDTASSLGMDIHRYLDHQPVSATPPSTVYRCKKLLWRHKFAFVTGGAIAVLLIGGSIVSAWQAVRAIRAEKLAETRLGSELSARHEAEKQRQLALEGLQSADASRDEAEVQRKLAENRLRSETAAREESERQKSLAEQERRRAVVAEKAAQAEVEISKAVNDFLQDDLLRQADSRVQAGTGATPVADLTVREALDRAAGRVEGRFGSRPLVEAGIRAVIGNTYLGLGEADKASLQLERALALRKAELGADDRGTISLMHQLALAYRAQGRLDSAIRLDAEALEISRRRTGAESQETLVSMTRLAASYLAQGRLAETTQLAEETAEISRRLYGATDLRTLIANNNLAVTYHQSSRFEEAASLFARTIEAAENALDANRLETLGWMVNLAQTYLVQGEIASAVSTLSKVVEGRKHALGPEHPDTLEAMSAFASAQRKGGNYNDATALFDEVITLRRRVLGPDHPDTLESLTSLATVYWLNGRQEEAMALFTRTARSQAQVLGSEHPDTVRTLSNVAAIYRTQGNLDEAAALLRNSVDARRRVLGRRHRDTFRSTRDLGAVYLQQRKFAEAEELLFSNCYHDLTNADVNELAGIEREAELTALTELIGILYWQWGDVARAKQWLPGIQRRGGRNMAPGAEAAQLDGGAGSRGTAAAKNSSSNVSSVARGRTTSSAPSGTNNQPPKSSSNQTGTPRSPTPPTSANPPVVSSAPTTRLRHGSNDAGGGVAGGSSTARSPGNVSSRSERSASRAAPPISISAPAVTSASAASGSGATGSVP